MAVQIMFIPLMIIFGILFFVFWLIMLVDAVTRRFKEGTDKIVWILVIILASFIGALIYYFVVYRKEKSLRWFWITLLVLGVITILLIIFIALLYSPVNVRNVG